MMNARLRSHREFLFFPIHWFHWKIKSTFTQLPIYSCTALLICNGQHMFIRIHSMVIHEFARRLFISSFFFAHSEWKCSLRLKSSFECCEFIVNNSAFVKFDTIFFSLFNGSTVFVFHIALMNDTFFVCVHSKWLHSLIKTNASLFLF